MCQKCVSSFQKRPWRIRRLVQHCMGVRGKLNRSCPCPTLHTVHFCNIVWSRGERTKSLIIFLKKNYFQKIAFSFFFGAFSRKFIKTNPFLRLSEISPCCYGCRKFSPSCYGCREFRPVATVVGNL